MDVQDVPAIVAAAHARGVVVALDNTWSAGVLFSAFDHGVDISVQALTKYVGGHSDLLLGSVSVRDESLYQRLGVAHQDLGMSCSPDDCSLALRGLQTLSVRLKAVEASALRVASWLADREEVETVLHPALPSCPGREIWKRDFSGSSGLFSFAPREPMSRREIHQAMDRLTLFRIGYSWGGVASLAVTPDTAGAPNARRFGERLIRLYIGLEDPDISSPISSRHSAFPHALRPASECRAAQRTRGQPMSSAHRLAFNRHVRIRQRGDETWRQALHPRSRRSRMR